MPWIIQAEFNLVFFRIDNENEKEWNVVAFCVTTNLAYTNDKIIVSIGVCANEYEKKECITKA